MPFRAKEEARAKSSTLVLRELRRTGFAQAPVVLPRARTPLHAMLSSVGYCRETAPDYDWRGLERGSAVWALLQIGIRGRGRLLWEGQEYIVTPEAAMLLEIPHDHRYHLPAGAEPWEFVYACLHGAEVMRVVRDTIKTRGPLLAVAHDSRLFATMCRAVHRAKMGFDSAYEASTLAYEIVMQLADHIDTSPGAHHRTAAMLRALRFGCEHFREAISARDLARAAGYSRSHFARAFHVSEGISPTDYLARLRLTEAAHLLGSTDLAVKEVALAAGFRDPNYFVRAFRKHWGVTPGTFRSSGQY